MMMGPSYKEKKQNIINLKIIKDIKYQNMQMVSVMGHISLTTTTDIHIITIMEDFQWLCSF